MSTLDSHRSARETAEASLTSATAENRSALEGAAQAARFTESTAVSEDRAAQERATQEKTYQEKAAAEKSAREKTKTEKVAEQKAAKQKAKAAKMSTYSEKIVTKGIALWGNRRHIITEHKPMPKTTEARAANRAAEAAKAHASQVRADRQKAVKAEASKQHKIEQRQGMIEGIQGRKGVTPERVSAIHREMSAPEKAPVQTLTQDAAKAPSMETSSKLSQIDAERLAMQGKVNEGKTQQGRVLSAKEYAQSLVAEKKSQQVATPGLSQPTLKKSRQNDGMGL